MVELSVTVSYYYYYYYYIMNTYKFANTVALSADAPEVMIEARCASEAIGKLPRKTANGKFRRQKLGKGWKFTRQADGWIIAAKADCRALGNTYFRLKEVNWDRSKGPFACG